MSELYLVLVDGRAERAELVGWRRALELALTAIDAEAGVEVAVADARTLRVCAWWGRRGAGWAVRAVDGWLN